jgi:hypothetical protein
MTIEVFNELKRLIVKSKISTHRLARESTVNYNTIDAWLDGSVTCPRIDTMLKVARVVGRQIELTGNVKRMVAYYPPPKTRPVRLALWRLQ